MRDQLIDTPHGITERRADVLPRDPGTDVYKSGEGSAAHQR